jgi:hypothetical protein
MSIARLRPDEAEMLYVLAEERFGRELSLGHQNHYDQGQVLPARSHGGRKPIPWGRHPLNALNQANRPRRIAVDAFSPTRWCLDTPPAA